jgi:hypothetical protein
MIVDRRSSSLQARAGVYILKNNPPSLPGGRYQLMKFGEKKENGERKRKKCIRKREKRESKRKKGEEKGRERKKGEIKG